LLRTILVVTSTTFLRGRCAKIGVNEGTPHAANKFSHPTKSGDCSTASREHPLHQRIVSAVSAVLFLLLAAVTVVLVDLHDYSYPQRLHAKTVVSLDLAPSDLTDDVAFEQLRRLSDDNGLGLVKLAPDLRAEGAGQVFVKVGDKAGLPQRVERFGDDEDAEVRERSALQHSYASGEYILTGSMDNVDALRQWVSDHQVKAEWNDSSIGTTLEMMLKQPSFFSSMIAIVALLVALALYWLSVKARGRALRTLAGVSTLRIQYEDLGRLTVTLASTLLIVAAAASVYVGVIYGWTFVPLYVSTLFIFGGVGVAIAVAGAAAMSVASWPTPDSLARRESPVVRLRKVAATLKAITFVVVLVAVGPAASSWSDAQNSAAQLGRWNALADQVALWFPAAMGEGGFQQIKTRVGDVVHDAEQADTVALSYAWSDEALKGVDLGSYDAVGLVSPRWIKLMAGHETAGKPADATTVLHDVPAAQVPPQIREHVEAYMELWLRDYSPEQLNTLQYRRLAQGTDLPLSDGGSGDLMFPENPLVVLVPDLHKRLDDDFLASTATSRNLVFTGLGPTEKLLADHGLAQELTVKFVAEDGILLAQFTAYFAWLQGFAMVALLVALVVSAVISASIVAILRARRDFPQRLAGHGWPTIVSQRVVVETGVGVVLILAALVVSGGQQPLLVLGTGLLALLVSPAIHVLASRWVFARVVDRQL
jgi:hypothetical protein